MMKKLLLASITLFLLSACSHKKDIPELLQGNFSAHTIMFDNQNPKLDFENNHLKEILVLLHHRIPEDKIKSYFKLNDSLWSEQINNLFANGLIKKTDEGKYLPTFFVLDSNNAIALKKFTDSLGVEMSEIAKDRLAKVKLACSKISSLKNFQFDNISLFILGCVLYDHWQQQYFQDQYLKSFVPHRGTSEFYFALIQNEKSSAGSINLFETTFCDYPAYRFGLYSNGNVEQNLLTIPSSNLKNDFGKKEDVPDSLFRKTLINELVELSKNPSFKIDPAHLAGLAKIGLVADGKSLVPFITKEDNKKLFEVASIVTNDLVNYFENRQTLFVKRFLNSQYREETNYKEWMAWIYKMIVTSTVEELTKKSVIKTSRDKAAVFIIQK